MPDISSEAREILAMLKERHNVLLSGPPGTGKSRLLGEVARAFLASQQAGPIHVPGAPVAIPKAPPVVATQVMLPSAERTDRKIFRTVFHQNSKHREFITGLVPVVGAGAQGAPTFRVVTGTLYTASEHAKTSQGASLLIIDEINRGPAVQVFGGSIVAIESDKRLAPNGQPTTNTQVFELMSPANGDLVEYSLPHHLYILAAMNQADTSVEPLDVAFLRRWMPYHLEPNESVLRNYFGLPATAKGVLPAAPASAQDVFEAATRAWVAINERIRIGRGAEMQIGHGVLMGGAQVAQDLPGALRDVVDSWKMLKAHVDEVFFGDTRSTAATLNIGIIEGHPLTLVDTTFGDEARLELVGSGLPGVDSIYALLRAIAG